MSYFLFCFIISYGILLAVKGTVSQRVQLYPTVRADAYLGDNLTLRCSYNGSGVYVINSWYRNTYDQGLVRLSNGVCALYGQLRNESVYAVACIDDKTVGLTVKNIQLQQHGEIWACSQTVDGTPYTSNTTTVFVKVLVTSVILTTPSSSTVTTSENSPLEFSCTTSQSRPAPTISWYLDGGTSTTDDDTLISSGVSQSPVAGSEGFVATTGSLTYRPSRDANGKYVFCKTWGDDQYNVLSDRKILLNVTYKPESGPLIQSYSNNMMYYAIDNKEQSLTCTAIGGNPLAALSWSCFTGNIENLSSGQNISTKWTWRTSSNGTCKCIATHLGVDEAIVLNVKILSTPTTPLFMLHSKTVQGTATVKVLRDSNTEPIICLASSYPPPDRYTWTYDVQSTTLSQVSSLNPSKITADGHYWCQVRNTLTPTQGNVEYGNSSTYINIQRLYAPVVQQLEDQPIVEGNTLSVGCKTTPGNPTRTTYTWMRKLNSSSGNDWQTITHSSVNGGILVKQNINRNDAGIYRCTASNLMEPTATNQETGSSSETFVLNVLYAPAVTEFFVEGYKGQKNVIVDEHDTDLRITCVIDGNSQSIKQILFEGDVIIEDSKNNDLTLVRQTVECLNSGVYLCKVTNQHGEQNTSKLFLYVKCSPRPLWQVKHNSSSPLNSPVTLNFSTLAYPEPGPLGFKWYKYSVMRWIPLLSNKDVKISSTGIQSNLTILNVVQSDYGQYRVSVENNVGTYEQYFFLEKEDEKKDKHISSDSGGNNDRTSLTIGIVLGLLSLVLAVYSTYTTILLKRKSVNEGINFKNESTKQPAYNQFEEESGNGQEELGEGSVRLYTDLALFSRDDKSTYDTIQKT